MCLRVLEEGFKVLNHEHEVLRMHLKLESSLTKVTKLYMLQSHNGHVSLNIKNLTNIDRGQSWSFAFLLHLQIKQVARKNCF